VPSVVISFATDPARWAPLDARLHRTVTTRAAGDCEAVLRVATRLRRKPAIAGAPDPLRGFEVSVSPVVLQNRESNDIGFGLDRRRYPPLDLGRPAGVTPTAVWR
jgi:hypothetical protein